MLDTSVLIASESGRPLDLENLPDEVFVCVITIAELQAGVLAAPDTVTRSRRLATLDSISVLEPLPVDAAAAAHWATLRVRLAEEKQRIGVNDLWIAACCLIHGLPLVTNNLSDFHTIAGEFADLRLVHPDL